MNQFHSKAQASSMANCIVNFNSPTGSYYSGQEVSGTITLYNEKPRSLRALLLKIEGFARPAGRKSRGQAMIKGPVHTRDGKTT